MAGKIRLLSDEVIGKIAAGEVVERPSAAIKEMVENSLDAGATAVTVEIRDGGITYFRVTDNGSGIRQSEIRMAFERHATSKITDAKDLFGIRTLGFRGEALASIAAVSHVACTTRTRDEASGVKIKNSGGQIQSIEEAACAEGTTFVVKDLFFNTPVRLKFLKKPATEAGYVSDLMMRLILSRPDVSFRYISNGKTLYHSAGDGKLSSAVFSIYGNELLRAMREVDGHDSGLVLKGFVGVGESSRATRAHQSFFINGRYMKSAVLSSAVEAACREQLPAGRYPTCVLHLTMPFEMVDVNVHPNKLECRFQNDAVIADAVEAIVREAFVDKSPLDKPEVLRLTPEEPNRVPVAISRTESVKPTEKQITISLKDTEVAEKAPVQQAQPVRKPIPVQGVLKPMQPVRRDDGRSLQQTPQAALSYARSYQQTPPPSVVRVAPAMSVRPVVTEQPKVQAPVKPIAPPKPAAAVTPSFLPEAPKPMRMIGTAFDSYILVEYSGELLLIDQQGVHERLLFDRMMATLGTQQSAQELLIPLIVPATRREQQLLENHHDLLASIGLTVETFGETEVAVRSIPMILGEPQAGEMLREVIDQLEGERGVVSLEKRRAGILALACKKSVRKGERLTEDDLRELVVRMVEKKVTPTSPRGTPLIVALTKTDIDRRFRRS